MLKLKNCCLIPETVEGYIGQTADIILDGDRIHSIVPCGTPTEECKELDMQNRYVLPGLFDLHIHLTLSGGDTLIDNMKSPVQMALDAVKFAQETMMAGFTTIRDVGSCHNVAVELRDAINSGKLTGPNILASGRILTPSERGNDFFRGMYVECDTIDELKRAVRKEMALGADFIKIMGTGAVMNPGGVPGQSIMPYEELKAVADAAAYKNTYVATHCHGTQAIKDSIRAGIGTIEHASLLDDECIEMLLKQNGPRKTYLVPTLHILRGLTENVPESSTFMMEKARFVLNGVHKGIRKAYEAGLKLGFGTDEGGTPALHGENANEFMLRRDNLGMSEIDLIKQATIDSAIIAGVDKDLGSIKVGKIADLIAVNGNPLEDISVFRYKLAKVIKSGVVVRNDD